MYLLCSGLNNEDERQSAPPYRDSALHFHAPRLIARIEKSSYAPRLRTYTQPAQLFAAGAQLAAHTQPALRTGLMAPAWRLLHVSRRVIFYLTFDLFNSDMEAQEHGLELHGVKMFGTVN